MSDDESFLNDDSNIEDSANIEDLDNIDTAITVPIDELSTLAAYLSNMEKTILSSSKRLELLEIYRKAAADTRLLQNLDEELKDYINTTSDVDQIIPYNEFASKLGNISDDSLIIYIKKAHVYKVYNSDQLDEFQNDDGTHYRKPEYGPAYEVVRDANPQKIMVVVKDNIRGEKLQQIKQDIVDCIKTNPAFSKTSVNDLRVYSSNNNTEFVVSNIKIQNITEKENIIDDFIDFLQKKGKQEIADKIQFRLPPSGVRGVRFQLLPSSKTSLDNIPSNILDQLLTTTPSGTNLTVNYTVINNNNQINSNNITSNTNNSVTNVVKKRVGKKTLETFYKHLYNSKPSWYIENVLVDIANIEKEYKEYFIGTEDSRSAISKKLKKIFVSSTRTDGTTKKKMLPFSDLKKLF